MVSVYSRLTTSARLRRIAQSLPRATHARLKWLTIIVCVALLGGMLSSARLWLPERELPFFPVFEIPTAVSVPLGWVAVVVVYALLVAVIVIVAASPVSRTRVAMARARMFIVALLIIMVMLVCLDQLRMQPWAYQYTLMLFVVWCGTRRVREVETDAGRVANDDGRIATALDVCRFIVAAIYVWSGIQKANAGFAGAIFPELIAPFLRRLPDAFTQVSWIRFALLIPALEIFIGLSLMTRSMRRVAVPLALVSHLVILALLVPTRRNSVVWLWNIAMMMMVVTLFWRYGGTWREQVRAWRSSWSYQFIVIVCGVLPLFSFFGWWDMYLSAALYSGNTAYVSFRIDEEVKKSLPPKAQAAVTVNRSGEMILRGNSWALAACNVPLNPEPRIYARFASEVCRAVSEPSAIEVRWRERPAWWSGEAVTKSYDCTQFR